MSQPGLVDVGLDGASTDRVFYFLDNEVEIDLDQSMGPIFVINSWTSCRVLMLSWEFDKPAGRLAATDVVKTADVRLLGCRP